MSRILICGHIDLTIKNFDDHYVPIIDSVLSKCDTFYVGGAKGVDTFAQDYLFKKNCNIIVCDKGDQNNNLYPSKYQHKNGFSSYIDRDAYMTDNVTDIIVFLKKHYMSLGSGSFSNVVRLVTNRSIADKFMKHARESKYDEENTTLENYCDNVIDTFDDLPCFAKDILKKKTREILIIEQ